MIFAAGVLHHVNMLEVVRHPWFISAVSGFIGAQVLKLIITWWRHRTWNFRELVSAGGMPSSHSAFVAALACAVGFTDGFDEPYAMIAVGFGLLVVCDAATVRRQAGEHAKLLNIVIGKLNDRLDADERIEVANRELRGVTLWGGVIGAVVGLSMSVVMWLIG